MGEQCKGCPWLDEEKKQCCRKAPRFCLLDQSDSVAKMQESVRTGSGRGEPRPE